MSHFVLNLELQAKMEIKMDRGWKSKQQSKKRFTMALEKVDRK